MNLPTYLLFAALGYLIAPVMLVWGWTRWFKRRPRIWNPPSTLSFVGFLFASASGFLAALVITYGSFGGFEHTGSLPYYSPNYGLFYRCVGGGEILSLLALVLTLSGMFRSSPLRWQAPLSAVGTLAFWLVASTWP